MNRPGRPVVDARPAGWALLAAIALMPPLARAQAESLPAVARPAWGQTLLLGVTVNGVAQEGMLRAVRLPEGLAIARSHWDDLHLQLPPAGLRLIEGEPHVLLAPGGAVRWTIDEATQTLALQAAAGAFLGQRFDLAAEAPRVTAPAVWAPFVNYDLQWQTRRGGASAADALWELGLLSPGGDLSSTQLSRQGGGTVRLDTRWQRDDPQRLARWQVGDTISHAGAWGRALRFGGVQWGTDFSLQPGFLSFPLPTLRGEAAVPSTLDVYVNNSQRLQSRLPAGPFDLHELPVVTGQGEIRTVVKDLLGREQVVVTPYYVSPALLKPGLRAFSLEAGVMREDYGLRSNRYGRALFSFTERRGVTERFTTEWRAEATGRHQAAGVGGWWLWPQLGTLGASAAASQTRGAGRGWLLQTGLDRQAGDWSGSVQWRRMSAGFTQLGQPAAPAPRSVLALAMGTSWAGQGVGVSFTRQHGGGVDTRLAQVNYGRELGRWGHVSALLFRDLARGGRGAGGSGGGTTLALSWSLALDDRHSAGVSVQRQPDLQGRATTVVQTQVQRNPAFGSGLGYQVLASSDGHQLAQTQWQGDQVVLQGAVGRRGGVMEARAGASGGLAWVDGSGFASRRIDGGIAVVDVGGHEGVRVTQDNQVIARTDARGRAVLTSLRGYQPNRVGILAGDLPMDAEVQAVEVQLTPAARSAARIDFPVQRGRGASLQVFDITGEALPPGTLLRPGPGERSFPVGLGGRAYLGALPDGRSTVHAQWLDARGAVRECRFDLALPPARGDDLPDLGALICR